MSKLQIQKIFADQVGARLELFKVQAYSPYRSNFRCPICGDSAKNKFKKRAFILEKGDNLIFYCHNSCGSMGFEKFLREYYDDLYTMYKFDIIRNYKNDRREQYIAEEIEESKPAPKPVDTLDIDLAETNKQAFKYLEYRQIPEKYWEDIFYTDYFFKFVNSKIPDKFSESMEQYIDRRIIFPLRDSAKSIFGIIGRSIDPSNKNRYITIKFDDNKPKIFGIDRLNRSTFAYVSEGPIDSFFIENCCALAGTDGRPDAIFSSKSDYALILDNQPRAPDVIKKYEKYIAAENKMVIWPEDIKAKDVNEMIMSGHSKERVNEMIRLNTYEGLKLRIMFNNWRKV